MCNNNRRRGARLQPRKAAKRVRLNENGEVRLGRKGDVRRFAPASTRRAAVRPACDENCEMKSRGRARAALAVQEVRGEAALAFVSGVSGYCRHAQWCQPRDGGGPPNCRLVGTWPAPVVGTVGAVVADVGGSVVGSVAVVVGALVVAVVVGALVVAVVATVLVVLFTVVEVVARVLEVLATVLEVVASVVLVAVPVVVEVPPYCQQP